MKSRIVFDSAFCFVIATERALLLDFAAEEFVTLSRSQCRNTETLTRYSSTGEKSQDSPLPALDDY
jgi:hypothetical protein